MEATLIPPDPNFPLLFPRKQYDIKDFRDLYIRNVIAEADNTAGGGIYTGNVGNIGIINGAIVNSTERNSVGIANSNGLIEVNGVNKLAGFNALSVTGGVTLSGGGTIHGITLGTQPVGGIDTIRLELLPLLGITLTTPILPITLTSGSAVLITAGGALTLTSGGILSLAGGDRIEYNTDENRFINSSAGNDFTDILVGNIFPAFGGSANLRINGGGSGRGVELSNVKSIYLPDNETSFISGLSTLINVRNLTATGLSTNTISTNTIFADNIISNKITGLSTFTRNLELISLIYNPWDALTTYNPGDRVEYLGINYDCVSPSLNLPPTGPIVVWTRFISFVPGNITYQSTGAGAGSYRCIDAYNGLPQPSVNPAYFVKISTNNSITNFWVVNSVGGSGASKINGDEFSFIKVGSGFYNNLYTSTINVSSINASYISTINTDNIVANSLKVSYINAKDIDNTSLAIGAGENITLTSGVDTIITGNQNISLIASNINFIGSNGISATGDWDYNNYNLQGISNLTADTINSFSTNTSTITTNSIFLKGAIEPYLTFYKPSDQETPIGIIGGTDELGLTILGVSDIAIQALEDIAVVANSNLVLGSGNETLIEATNQIELRAPLVAVPETLFASTIISFDINTSNVSSFISVTNELYTNSIGNPNPITPTPIRINNFLNFGSNSIFDLDDIRANSLSTSLISTLAVYSQQVYTDSLGNPNALIPTPIKVNNNLNLLGNDLSNILRVNASNISTNNFSTGSLFAGVVSTLQVNTSSIRANRALIDRLNPLTDSGVVTGNFYPGGAGSQIGYGFNTAQGGFYAQGTFRSTFTQVIQPTLDAGIFSNVVRVNGNLSTPELFVNNVNTTRLRPYNTTRVEANYIHSEGNVANSAIGSGSRYYNEGYFSNISSQSLIVSTINRKLYPYTSTLNIPHSSFSITGSQAGTPILLYSNVQFLNQGFHRISQKAILSKNSGGSSQDIHGNIFYTVGSFPSTPSITDGYSALAYANQDNASTFTTLMTEFYVSTPTTRNILYYDSTANNYTARLYLGTLFDTFSPDLGNNPTRIPSIF